MIVTSCIEHITERAPTIDIDYYLHDEIVFKLHREMLSQISHEQ